MAKRFFSIAFAAVLAIGAPLAAMASVPPVASAVEAVPAFEASTENIKHVDVIAVRLDVDHFKRVDIGTARIASIDRSSAAPASFVGLHRITSAEPEPVPWLRE